MSSRKAIQCPVDLRTPNGKAGGWQRGHPRLPVLAARALLLITVLLGTGCTPVRWDRPETDAATQEADIQACRGHAHRDYNTLAYQPLLPPYLVTVRDNKGRLREIPVVPSPQFGPAIGPSYAPPPLISWRSVGTSSKTA